MNDRISGLAVVVHGRLDQSVEKSITQELPQVVRVGSLKVEEQLQFLGTKTKQSLSKTFDDLGAHWGSVLDRMAQRIAKGNFTVNTENTLKGIRLIGEELGNLNLKLTAGKLLDLGEHLRIPQTTQQVKELTQEFKVFVTQAQQYDNWLRTFANRPEKPGLSSPLSGQTKFFAEAHGSANQLAMSAAEDAYDNYYLAQEGKRRAAITGRKLDEQSNAPVALSPAAQALQEEERLAKLAAKANSSPYAGSTAGGRVPGTVPMSPAAIAAMEEDWLQQLTKKANASPYGGTGRLNTLAGTVPLSPSAQQLIDEEKNKAIAARRSGLALDMAVDQYSRSPEERRGMNRGDQHRLRFGTQNLAFGIDDAIQSYHYGGAAASIRAASNNVTAMAGLGISNPMLAAGSVVAISALSAILTKIIPLFSQSQAFKEDVESTQKNGFITRSTLTKGLFKGEGRSLFDSSVNSMMEDSAQLKSLSDENAQIKEDFRQKAKEELIRIQSHGPIVGMMRMLIGDSLMEDINKRQDLLAANNQERLNAVRRIKINEDKQKVILKNIDTENKMDALGSIFGRDLSDSLAQGSIASPNAYRQMLADQLEQKKKLLQGSGLPQKTIDYSIKKLQLDNDRLLMDPEIINRQVALSRLNAATDRSAFNSTFGTAGAVAGVTSKFNGLMAGVNGQVIQGSLSRQEADRRLGLLGVAFGRERGRAFEDELNEANPEVNPLKRLTTNLNRRLQDLNLEKNLTDDERRRMMAAILSGAQTAKSKILEPSGTRRFSAGEAIDVNSAHDLELQQRMTQNFSWQKAKEDHSQKSLEDIKVAIESLKDQLKLDAEMLERK